MPRFKIQGKRVKVPSFPHHKYFIYAVSKFFRMPNLLNLLLMDKFNTITQIRMGKKHGCFVPRCLLLDPTSNCNINCIGCWAAGYKNSDNLTFDKLDSILDEAEELKIRYCFLSGGEPLVRKEDILKLVNKHQKISFSAFTNGTLIDETFADEMKKAGNLTVAISLEGFKEDTDYRRGDGTFEKIMKAMDILKNKDIAFSFSVCYHSKNYKTIASERFLDLMREKGAWMGWMFTYIPVGKDADTSLVCTPQQRAYVMEKINAYNKKHNITIIDFWNNGHLSAGCVAASTGFVHINARGDIEPCAFCHYSDSNIHDMKLVDGLKGKFFTEFRKNQPFNKNPLRSCPLIDMPEKIEKVVEKSGAKSTELASPETVYEFTEKTKPVAKNWAPVAEELFQSMPKKRIRSINRNMKILNHKKTSYD
jgi:MoaA/NifB/PqqE/SkfB family radical SAM enzyme